MWPPCALTYSTAAFNNRLATPLRSRLFATKKHTQTKQIWLSTGFRLWNRSSLGNASSGRHGATSPLRVLGDRREFQVLRPESTGRLHRSPVCSTLLSLNLLFVNLHHMHNNHPVSTVLAEKLLEIGPPLTGKRS